MRFTVAGQGFDLDHDGVKQSLKGHKPVRDGRNKHFIHVRGVAWPVKQVLGLATGIDPISYPTSEAVRVLTRCGFVVGPDEKKEN